MHADAAADGVVMVAVHLGVYHIAAVQRQGVDKVFAFKVFIKHAGGEGAVVVVNHIIGAQQHVYIGAALASERHGAAEFADFQAYALRAADLAGQQYALADKAGHIAVGGCVVEGVGVCPLLQAALVHYADLVAHGKGFLLVVGNQ